MGFYEDRRDLTAHPLILKRGAAMFVRRVGGETFNPATGAMDSEGTDTDYPTVGVMFPFRQSDIDGTLVKQSDMQVILSALDTSTGLPLTIVPNSSDTLIIGADEWQIINVEPLRPGGIDVIYTLQVRE